ncbi:MAG: hypothetical protein JWP81_5243 [Ferruginibacter sp.]|nr:hypothetical protein [Ferruginibacter sp.]
MLKPLKKQGYLFKSIAGIILVALSIYAFVEDAPSKDDFQLFMRIIFALLCTGYTVHYVVCYFKYRHD